MNEIEDLKLLAFDLNVLDISNEVLDLPDFAIWSGAGKPDQHHYGDGGLLKHTWEVVTLCMENANILADFGYNISVQELFLAALFHDVGKIWDYQKIDDVWKHTEHKKLVHHISRSGIFWVKTVEKFPKYKNIEDNVLHDILSHHGFREFGSPVLPQSKTAWLLHLCDSISARMNDCEINKLYK